MQGWHFPASAPLVLGCALLAGIAGCSDASLYSVQGDPANLPDRVAFEGDVCEPIPSGRNFPARIVFAVQGGVGVDPNVRADLVEGITQATARYTSPYLSYGLVAFNDFAFSLVPASYGGTTELATGLTQYTSFSQGGPLSLGNALALVEAMASGDMSTACPGARARTRYAIVVVVFSADQAASCVNLDKTDACFKAKDCASCTAERSTRRIRDLARKYGAGQVTVQPVYVLTGPADQTVLAQVAAIAAAGGTREIVSDERTVKESLKSLNLAGIAKPFRLKSLLAWNRNARARAGELLADSDGDGLTDGEEATLGTLPDNLDTDGDGLMDGIEILVGLDPLTPNVVRGCDPGRDQDRDGLTACEERLLGTEDCMGDTDGDGVPDLVEAFSGTNPLQAEQTRDTDRDGFANQDELRRHSDPLSDDLNFIGSRSYTYQFEEVAPPPPGSVLEDPCPGRTRNHVTVRNIGLVQTGAVPGGPPGVNNIYVYSLFAPGDDLVGGLSRLHVEPVVYAPPSKRDPPAAVLPITEETLETRP